MRQQPTALHEHRPLARTVLRLENPGMPIAEIAWRREEGVDRSLELFC